MTTAAAEFIRPLTFQALSGHPVQTTLLDADAENAMGHINLARWADVLVIAPASADLLAKLSHGLADDLLSTLYLAATCPVYVAPAMNQAMWSKTVTQANVERLKTHGVKFIGPTAGDQACGETGLGRMSEPEDICRQLLTTPASVQASSELAGLKILISAGPTREPLDPVRYITNRSSGKMGYALAEAAINMGADVTLVSGPVQLAAPAQARLIQVETAAQMYAAVLAEADSHAIYIGAAAVADYSPVPAPEKLKKHAGASTLVLHKTQDILAAVAALTPPPFTVGFAAETENLTEYALGKLQDKKLAMIAANWVGKAEGGFDSDQNALQVFWPTGQKALAMTDKSLLAQQLLSLIAEHFHNAMP